MNSLMNILPRRLVASPAVPAAVASGPVALAAGRWYSDQAGSGAGKGGGAGGSVRSSGGSFGKKEAAEENVYFRQKDHEALEDIKEHPDHAQPHAPEKPQK
eukprot:Nk52_evm12s367 gene=Nk52_evmTU12s367